MAEPPASVANTGGPYVAGNVDTGGGHFVGRDLTYGYTAEQVTALITEVRRSNQPVTWDGRSPYLGLAAFQELDAEFFFGREKLVEELLERVQQARFVCVAGPSGSGKSSLVQAGLIHALRQGKLAGSNKWRYTILTPRSDPIEQLAQAMARLAQNPDASQYLRTHGLTDAYALYDQAEALLNADLNQRLVVYVDQFEELFTQTKDETQQCAFLALLTTAVQRTESRVIIILALRADFVAHCASYPELRRLINQQFQLVGALEPEELARAIVLPALAVGAQLEPALVEQLIAHTEGEPGALPLLEFALKDLFDAQDPHKDNAITLTLNDYLVRGGLHQALERHAESVFAQLTDTQQQLARQIFTHLIEVGQGAEDSRRTATFAELLTNEAITDEVETVVQLLAHARLITIDDPNHGQNDAENPTRPKSLVTRSISLAHEKLIDAWPWLRRLVDENREWIALQNSVSRDAQTWEKQGCDPSYLYTGARLTVICEALAAKGIKLHPEAQGFIEASQEAAIIATRQHRRNRYFQISALVGIVGLLVVALLINQVRQGQKVQIQQTALTAQARANATIVADGTRQAVAAATIEVQATAEAKAGATAIAARASAEREAAIARSRQLALQSTNALNTNDYESAILLAIEAGQATDSLEAFAAIRNTISTPWHNRTILLGHTAGVTQATWNKDETRILTASQDGTARIWDAATGQALVILAGHKEAVIQATWNKDETRILTASQDGTARIWDTATGQVLVTLTGGPKEAITQATWNKDETRILTVSHDGTAPIFGGDFLTGMEHDVDKDKGGDLPGPGYGEVPLFFSADQLHHYSAVRIWDAATGQVLVTLTGHTSYIYQAIWNKDGTRILTAAYNTARIWDAATGQVLVTFIGHKDYVYEAAWNKAETHILTASKDGTARIWDAASGQVLVTLTGHKEAVTQAAWNKAETHILTASKDGTARIWDAASGQVLVTLTGHKEAVTQAAWNKAETHILTASQDGTARIWDAATGQALVTLTRHKEAVTQATWNKAETRILTASEDGTARLWDAAINPELVTLADSDSTKADADSAFLSTSLQASWNKDETRILITNKGTARIWDAASGQVLVTLTDHNGGFTQANWNKDGTRILTASEDGTARIWDAASSHVLITFTGHKEAVTQVAWNKDETRILTASYDGTARIWDAATGQSLTTLAGPATAGVDFYPLGPNAIEQALWNKDETRVLIVDSYFSHLGIWDAATGQELINLAGHNEDAADVWATWDKDEPLILITSPDRAARIWDVATGHVLVTFTEHPEVFAQATWNKDGTRILTASQDGPARIWGSATGHVLVTLAGHLGAFTQATWNKEGTRILTVSGDGTARIWDAATGHVLISFTESKSDIVWASWNKDETRVLTANQNGTAHILYANMVDLISAACRHAPSNFTWDTWYRLIEDDYRPTCSNASIPADVIDAMQIQIASLAQQGEVKMATTRMQVLNGWLRTNGQYKSIAFDLLKDGQKLAQSGNITDAVKSYQRAIELDPAITISPLSEAKHQYAVNIIQQAKEVTKNGKITDAIKSYEQARTIDPTITIPSDLEIKSQYASFWVEEASISADNGLITDSLQAISEAQRLDPNVVIGTYSWRNLCWQASIYGDAQQVVHGACEEAVKLARADEISDCQDSRGLARALTGDVKGAQEDFRAFVAASTGQNIEARKAWIKRLEAGEDPKAIFGAATLEKLKHE